MLETATGVVLGLLVLRFLAPGFREGRGSDTRQCAECGGFYRLYCMTCQALRAKWPRR